MNYTENYHLPQWEETDRIMRTDFNDAMANIETGITDAASSYVAGYYTGTGEAHKIVIGFKPRMLLIHGYREPSQSTEEHSALSSVFLNAPSSRILTYQEDGFTLYGSALTYPRVNLKNFHYAFIAFR